MSAYPCALTLRARRAQPRTREQVVTRGQQVCRRPPQDHHGVRGVQAPQLHHQEEPSQRPRPPGSDEVLPQLRQAHGAPRDPLTPADLPGNAPQPSPTDRSRSRGAVVCVRNHHGRIRRVSDRPEDPFDAQGAAEDPAEEARGLRAVLGRQAVDTRPLRIPEYRRILIGQGTSFIGSMLTQVAVPVQIWALPQSPLYVGFVGLAGLVPIVVFGLYGGAIADAVDRRVLYLWSSIGGWVVTLALLVQTLLDLGNVWLILALVFVQSGMFAVASSARGAIIPRIVATELVPAANTLNFTVGNVGQVVGPLIAGLLLVLPNGFALVYAADALLFTAALYSVLKLPSIPPQGEVQRPDWRAVAEGLRFIAVRPVLVMSFAVDIAAMVLAMPRSLFPAVADARFGGQVGPLYAAIALGSVVAGLSSGWIGRVRRPGGALVVAIVGWGAAVALSGLAHQLWLVVVLLALAGAADLISAVYRQTILQTYA